MQGIPAVAKKSREAMKKTYMNVNEYVVKKFMESCMLSLPVQLDFCKMTFLVKQLVLVFNSLFLAALERSRIVGDKI